MTKKKLVAIVDDWERLERYEEHLTPYFEVHCAPFGKFGVELALELKPEFILVDVVFEDLHEDEVRKLVRSQPSLSSSQLIVISDSASTISPAGRDFLLQRPVTWSALIDFLKKASMSSG